MRKIILITYLLIFLACSSNTDKIQEIDASINLQECNDIEDNRKIIAEFSNEEGHIMAPDEECPVYTIEGGPDHPGRNLRLLAPCNLPESFKGGDIKIVFSGYLYETFETEDICAQLFELTKISFKK